MTTFLRALATENGNPILNEAGGFILLEPITTSPDFELTATVASAINLSATVAPRLVLAATVSAQIKLAATVN